MSITVGECMLAAYRSEVPERIPVAIYSRYLPRGTRERTSRELGLGVIDFHPVVSLLAPPWHLLSGYLSEVRGVDLRVSYSWEKGQRVETRAYETPVGTIYQQTTIDPTYGSDWIRKHYITEMEHYKVMQYVVENTVLRPQEEALRAKIKDMGTDGVVLGRVDRNPYQKLLIELAGPERFLMDLYTQPEPVLELLDAMDRRMDEVFAMVLDSQAEIIWQPDNVTADMTPPAAYDKFCLPYYQKHGRLRQAGKRYLIHMDGRLAALEEHIGRSSFDGVESFSFRDVGGDMTLSEARTAWPDKVIFPNFPSALANKTDAEIETWLVALLQEAGNDQPLMLQFSEDIPHDQWQRVVPLVSRLLDEHAHRQR